MLFGYRQDGLENRRIDYVSTIARQRTASRESARKYPVAFSQMELPNDDPYLCPNPQMQLHPDIAVVTYSLSTWHVDAAGVRDIEFSL